MNRNVTITITPNIEGFMKALNRVGYVAEGCRRTMKKINRKTRILGKQIAREAINEARSKPLIHNGKGKR